MNTAVDALCRERPDIMTDAYAALDAIVYETKNFRGQRIEAVVDEAKN